MTQKQNRKVFEPSCLTHFIFELVLFSPKKKCNCFWSLFWKCIT